MHVNLLRRSNAGSELSSRPCTGFFSHNEGEILPEAWILSNTGRPTKKTHEGRVPSGRPVHFGSTLGKSCRFKRSMQHHLVQAVFKGGVYKTRETVWAFSR